MLIREAAGARGPVVIPTSELALHVPKFDGLSAGDAARAAQISPRKKHRAIMAVDTSERRP